MQSDEDSPEQATSNVRRIAVIVYDVPVLIMPKAGSGIEANDVAGANLSPEDDDRSVSSSTNNASGERSPRILASVGTAIAPPQDATHVASLAHDSLSYLSRVARDDRLIQDAEMAASGSTDGRLLPRGETASSNSRSDSRHEVGGSGPASHDADPPHLLSSSDHSTKDAIPDDGTSTPLRATLGESSQPFQRDTSSSRSSLKIGRAHV